jgi:hypothetical protein
VFFSSLCRNTIFQSYHTNGIFSSLGLSVKVAFLEMTSGIPFTKVLPAPLIPPSYGSSHSPVYDLYVAYSICIVTLLCVCLFAICLLHWRTDFMRGGNIGIMITNLPSALVTLSGTCRYSKDTGREIKNITILLRKVILRLANL